MSYASLLNAISFAADKHCNQKRKDQERSPYVNHPIAVAAVLADVGNVVDESILIAAILHDTVEDTDATFEELEKKFGSVVTGIVREVTDDKEIEKTVRKRLQIEHAPHISASAKQLKIADKICNVRDILNSPPHDWSVERRQEYLEWACKVVDGCRGVNPGLDKTFDVTLATGNTIL